MTIEFGPCPACGKWPLKPEDAKPDWAVLAGWDGCVGWIRDQKDAPPISGYVRQIEVSYPFRGEPGEAFWCLWAPFDAYESGYEEFPGLLLKSRIIEVSLLEILASETERLSGKVTHASVEVLRCLSCSDLLMMPQREVRNVAGTEWLREVEPDACTGELCFAEMNLEGDLGSWVVWANKDGFRHILLEGIWGSHESYFFAGHMVV